MQLNRKKMNPSHQKIPIFKLKVITWLFRSKPLKDQKDLIKLKNLLLWKKHSRKLLKRPTAKESLLLVRNQDLHQ